jgi:CubicO group peptidase (beta-lactamase class C family)
MTALSLVARWPTAEAAVGVARFDPLRGPGRGVEVREVTGPTEQSFPWASVTKLATALAVLVAVEEGSMALDDPAGPPGATVAHLLCHGSGLGPRPDPPLMAPGLRRIYSNAGYQVLAEQLATRTGIGFADYLQAGVLDPLGMLRTTLDPEQSSGPAAAGLSGPLVDLLALAGEWAVPTLLSAETHRLATSVRFASLAGVVPGFGSFAPCDWGLGPEIRGRKQPHWTGTTNSPPTFGHFGRAGSFLWIDPSAAVLCVGLAGLPFGPWAKEAWPELADAVLADGDHTGRGD